MTNKHVSIILVNFNGWADTIECIESLYKQDYLHYNIILIENGSTNDSFIELNKWLQLKDNVHFSLLNIDSEKNLVGNNKVNFEIKQNYFIRSKINYGFAGGNNIGVKLSQKINSDYVLLLNNDTVVEPNFLSKLISFQNANPEYVALTPQIRLFDPSNKIWNCGGKLYWPLLRKYYYAGQDISNVPQTGFQNISYITGCALFFDYKKAGCLTENFFFGEEDIEFSNRAKKNKWKMACVFDSIIYHKVNGSIILNKTSLNKVRLYYTNRFINLKNNYSFFEHKLAMLMMTVYGTIMLARRQNVKLSNSIKLFKKVYSDTKNLNKVDKQTFERILFQEQPF